ERKYSFADAFSRRRVSYGYARHPECSEGSACAVDRILQCVAHAMQIAANASVRTLMRSREDACPMGTRVTLSAAKGLHVRWIGYCSVLLTPCRSLRTQVFVR